RRVHARPHGHADGGAHHVVLQLLRARRSPLFALSFTQRRAPRPTLFPYTTLFRSITDPRIIVNNMRISTKISSFNKRTNTAPFKAVKSIILCKIVDNVMNAGCSIIQQSNEALIMSFGLLVL